MVRGEERIGSNVRCWGNNQFGEVGAGSLRASLFPPVRPFDDYEAFSTSSFSDSTCAHITLGAPRPVDRLLCWGRSDAGQTGTGQWRAANSTPDLVLFREVLLDQMEHLAVGGDFTCVSQHRTCTLRCWGQNRVGQLGDGRIRWVRSSGPSTEGVEEVTILVAGDRHACAFATTTPGIGNLWCWAGKDRGQVGVPPAFLPVGVELLRSPAPRALAAGRNFTCLLSDEDDTVRCRDGVRDSAEQCDDGNLVDGTLVDGNGSDSGCMLPECGNSVVSGSERYDDGESVNGDGCDNNCTPTGCGDGIITTGETCDDGNQSNNDGCISFCFIGAPCCYPNTCGDAWQNRDSVARARSR